MRTPITRIARITTAAAIVTALGLSIALEGCGKKDPLDTSAPPPGNDSAQPAVAVNKPHPMAPPTMAAPPKGK
jgi:hypothetical protein